MPVTKTCHLFRIGASISIVLPAATRHRLLRLAKRYSRAWQRERAEYRLAP